MHCEESIKCYANQPFFGAYIKQSIKIVWLNDDHVLIQQEMCDEAATFANWFIASWKLRCLKLYDLNNF